jgi:hypothetical protein
MASKAEKARVEQELRDRGAVLEKREDRHGETRSGWWLDGVWLAPGSDPVHALALARGD